LSKEYFNKEDINETLYECLEETLDEENDDFDENQKIVASRILQLMFKMNNEL